MLIVFENNCYKKSHDNLYFGNYPNSLWIIRIINTILLKLTILY